MNIDFSQVKQLIDMAEQANIHQLQVCDGTQSVTVTCQPPHGQSQLSAPHPQLPSTSTVPDQPSADANHKADPSPTSAAATSSHDDMPAAAVAEKSSQDSQHLSSPMVGTFYRRHDPNAEPLCAVGDRVEAGDVVCVVEAMKIMHEVKAEHAAIIAEILVEDGEMVEYDQPLFALKVESDD